MRELYNTFSFLQIELLSEEELKSSIACFVQKYSSDVSIDLVGEIVHLNFEPNSPLTKLKVYKLGILFPELMLALVLFCTLSVTVASVERSFRTLDRVQNFLHSCSGMERTSHLPMFCNLSSLARKLNFKPLMRNSAEKKARICCFEK